MRAITLNTLVCLFVLVFVCNGQTTFEAFVQPQAGDSIFSLVDNLPAQIDVGQPGPDMVWDFTSLQAPFVRKFRYLDDGGRQACSWETE